MHLSASWEAFQNLLPPILLHWVPFLCVSMAPYAHLQHHIIPWIPKLSLFWSSSFECKPFKGKDTFLFPFSFSIQSIVPSTFSKYLLNKWINLVLRKVILHLRWQGQKKKKKGWRGQFDSKLMTSLFNHKVYFKNLFQIFLILDKVSFLETRESLLDIFGIWLENWKPPKNRK